jgi:hypothetical protein
MRLPARLDLDDMSERRPDGRESARDASLVVRPDVRLLRSLCVAAPDGTTCIDHPSTTQSTTHPSGRAVHAEGLAVFSLTWTEGLYATFEGFDTSVQLPDASRLPTEALVLEDCCEPARWSEDGAAQISYAPGRVRRDDKNAAWSFVLDQPICGIDHVRGDERVVTSFVLEGKAVRAIPVDGIPLAGATATLRRRGPAPSSYVADVTWVGALARPGVRLP